MEEIRLKGIVVGSAYQGEYGRRLKLITDGLGRITVFAQGAAKAGSKLIGAVRPFTCAEFELAKGKNAYNLRGVKVIESFDGIALDPDVYAYASYVLETAEYFSAEGMDIREAKNLLNLVYVTLKALSGMLMDGSSSCPAGAAVSEGGENTAGTDLSCALIVSIYELRLLKLEGEYTTEMPLDDGSGSYAAACALWKHSLSSPLTSLYAIPACLDKAAEDLFKENVKRLFERQVRHDFKSVRAMGFMNGLRL